MLVTSATIKLHIRQGSLSVHIQFVHKSVKYVCYQCDYEAKTQRNLRVHVQCKHDVIKYACNQCDHEFTKQSSLTTHIQSIHKVSGMLVTSVTNNLHTRPT